MNFTNTKSVLSTVNYRDLIFLDKVTRVDNKLIMEGEINSHLIALDINKDFIPIQIVLNSVIYFKSENIDYNILSATAISNFCIIKESEKIMDYCKINNSLSSDYNHYVICEYDYVYEVIATGYKIFFDKIEVEIE